MALGGQHVSGFSPDGKLFALVNDQGILKIWDTETNELKQEYTPNLHLTGPCCAIKWVAVTQQKKSKKERTSLTPCGSLYIALGTSTGGVSLYSYALGKVERNFQGEGHTGKVTAICYDNIENLITCGEDCQVIVWSLPNEKQTNAWSIGNEKPHSIAYLANSNKIVIGSRQIQVYSVETQEQLQTFTGHTSEVTILDTILLDNTEYAITASKMERIICLWKIGKKGKNKPASSTLLMEDIANCLTCQLDDDGNLKVASVTRSGVIHSYLIPPDSIKSEKRIKPKVTIEIASDSATVIEPIPAVAASLQHAAKNEILFGYGDKHFMVFEQIEPNYGEKLQVLIRTEPKKRFLRTAKKESSSGSAVKTITPLVDHNNVDYKSGATISRKKLKPVELPFESRLQNLKLNVGEKPQPESKVQLLMQALHSRDAAMLMTVLSTDDVRVIQMTLQRLPVQYVSSIVNELTILMQSKRTKAEISARWLKVLVQTHSSQLMAMGADNLLEKFGPCIGVIEHRANSLAEISKLSGRLDLLLSQIKRKTEEDSLNIENALLYEDKDTSDSEMDEGSSKGSASDGEWEEDEESVEDMET